MSWLQDWCDEMFLKLVRPETARLAQSAVGSSLRNRTSVQFHFEEMGPPSHPAPAGVSPLLAHGLTYMDNLRVLTRCACGQEFHSSYEDLAEQEQRRGPFSWTSVAFRRHAAEANRLAILQVMAEESDATGS